MKKQILSVIFITIFAVFLGNLSAITEGGQNSRTIKYYENILNETILINDNYYFPSTTIKIPVFPSS